MNTLVPFQFEDFPARGRLLRLTNLENHVHTLKGAPAETAQTLAELLTLAALLTSDSKHSLATTLQIQHAESGSLMFAHANLSGNLKAYANAAARQTPFSALRHGGMFAVTLEPASLPGQEPQRFQSMVNLGGESAAGCLQTYFSTSVQTPTYLVVSTAETPQGFTCGALMLQALPGLTPEDDNWQRLGHIMKTLATPKGTEELTTLPAEEILHRLFHEDTLRLFEIEEPTWTEENMRPRMLAALASLPQEEIRELLIKGPITLTDETSGQTHSFSATDLAHILATDHPTSH